MNPQRRKPNFYLAVRQVEDVIEIAEWLARLKPKKGTVSTRLMTLADSLDEQQYVQREDNCARCPTCKGQGWVDE